MFQGRFKDVSRKSKGCSKEASRLFPGKLLVFQGCFKSLSRKFQENLNGILTVLIDHFMEVSIKIQGYFQGASIVFQGCLENVWKLQGHLRSA